MVYICLMSESMYSPSLFSVQSEYMYVLHAVLDPNSQLWFVIWTPNRWTTLAEPHTYPHVHTLIHTHIHTHTHTYTQCVSHTYTHTHTPHIHTHTHIDRHNHIRFCDGYRCGPTSARIHTYVWRAHRSVHDIIMCEIPLFLFGWTNLWAWMLCYSLKVTPFAFYYEIRSSFVLSHRWTSNGGNPL